MGLGFDQRLPSKSVSAPPRHFSPCWPPHRRMCITGREVVLISPISPRLTWLEKPGQVQAMRNQAGEGGVGGARQDKEQARGDRQNAERDRYRERRQPGMETLQAAARGRRDAGVVHRAADFAAGQRRHRKQQIERQEKEEIEVDGEDGRRDQFQKRDHRGIQMIAAGLGGQDFDDRQEEDQVHGGA